MTNYFILAVRITCFMLHKHLQHLFNPVDEMLKHVKVYKRENSQKSLADDISPPLDLHQSQKVYNIISFSPTCDVVSIYVLWSLGFKIRICCVLWRKHAQP